MREASLPVKRIFIFACLLPSFLPQGAGVCIYLSIYLSIHPLHVPDTNSLFTHRPLCNESMHGMSLWRDLDNGYG